ncbi:MAG: hypothetical protein ACJ76L_08220 [Conexibacter sp.]
MNRCKLLLAMLGASALLCAASGTASARNFSASSQTFSVTWARFEITGAFGTYSCPVTIEGSFHTRTIAKNVGGLIGYVTRASVGLCSTGLFETRVLTETLPWHVRYRSFTGLLPNIGSISTSIIGFALQVKETPFAIRCLGASSAAEPLILNFGGEPTVSGTITTNCPGGPAPRLSFRGAGTAGLAFSLI